MFRRLLLKRQIFGDSKSSYGHNRLSFFLGHAPRRACSNTAHREPKPTEVQKTFLPKWSFLELGFILAANICLIKTIIQKKEKTIPYKEEDCPFDKKRPELWGTDKRTAPRP